MSASSFAFAAPDSIAFAASGIASPIASTRPAATSAAAAFNSTTSRRDECSPSRMERMMAAFSFTSPPEMSSSVARLDSELLGFDFVGVNRAVADFRDARCAGDGDFVETVAAVNDERAFES